MLVSTIRHNMMNLHAVARLFKAARSVSSELDSLIFHILRTVVRE